MSGYRHSVSDLCVSTVRALGNSVADWFRERHLDFEAGIRYRTPAGRLYAYLWWLGLIFAQVVLALIILDGLMRYAKSARDLARGEQYLAANDFATAEACFDAALRAYPYSVAPYQFEGQLMLTRYFAGDSQEGFQPNVNPASTSGETGSREQLVHDGMAFLDVAIRLEGRRTLPIIVRKQGEKISDAYFWRGRGHLHLGDYERGIADFSNTIRIQPEHAGAYFYRGCCYFVLRKFDAADVDFEQAIKLDPDLRPLLVSDMPFQKTSPELERLITGLTRQITNLQRDRSQRPQLARLYAARGDVYILKNEFDAAFADYSRCLELDGTTDREIRNRVSLVRKLALVGE